MKYMERAFGFSWWRLSFAERLPVFEPPADILETEEGFLVRLEMAGADPRCWRILVSEKEILIAGRRLPPSRPLKGVVRMEIFCGDFAKRLALPRRVNPEAASGQYCAGFLDVDLPYALSEPSAKTSIEIVLRD